MTTFDLQTWTPLLLGMYLSWVILLFGAQTAYVFQFRHAYLQDRRAGLIHQRGREFLALRVMTLAVDTFLKGERPLTASQFAERLQAPPKLAKDLLLLLQGSRLLVEAAGPEPGYVPARPPARITPREVLEVLRAGGGQDLPTADDPARAVVRAEFEAILEAGGARAGAVSLEDLARRGPPVGG